MDVCLQNPERGFLRGIHQKSRLATLFAKLVISIPTNLRRFYIRIHLGLLIHTGP